MKGPGNSLSVALGALSLALLIAAHTSSIIAPAGAMAMLSQNAKSKPTAQSKPDTKEAPQRINMKRIESILAGLTKNVDNMAKRFGVLDTVPGKSDGSPAKQGSVDFAPIKSLDIGKISPQMVSLEARVVPKQNMLRPTVSIEMEAMPTGILGPVKEVRPEIDGSGPTERRLNNQGEMTVWEPRQGQDVPEELITDLMQDPNSGIPTYTDEMEKNLAKMMGGRSGQVIGDGDKSAFQPPQFVNRFPPTMNSTPVKDPKNPFGGFVRDILGLGIGGKKDRKHKHHTRPDLLMEPPVVIDRRKVDPSKGRTPYNPLAIFSRLFTHSPKTSQQDPFLIQMHEQLRHNDGTPQYTDKGPFTGDEVIPMMGPNVGGTGLHSGMMDVPDHMSPHDDEINQALVDMMNSPSPNNISPDMNTMPDPSMLHPVFDEEQALQDHVNSKTPKQLQRDIFIENMMRSFTNPDQPHTDFIADSALNFEHPPLRDAYNPQTEVLSAPLLMNHKKASREHGRNRRQPQMGQTFNAHPLMGEHYSNFEKTQPMINPDLSQILKGLTIPDSQMTAPHGLPKQNPITDKNNQFTDISDLLKALQGGGDGMMNMPPGQGPNMGSGQLDMGMNMPPGLMGMGPDMSSADSTMGIPKTTRSDDFLSDIVDRTRGDSAQQQNPDGQGDKEDMQFWKELNDDDTSSDFDKNEIREINFMKNGTPMPKRQHKPIDMGGRHTQHPDSDIDSMIMKEIFGQVPPKNINQNTHTATNTSNNVRKFGDDSLFGIGVDPFSFTTSNKKKSTDTGHLVKDMDQLMSGLDGITSNINKKTATNLNSNVVNNSNTVNNKRVTNNKKRVNKKHRTNKRKHVHKKRKVTHKIIDPYHILAKLGITNIEDLQDPSKLTRINRRISHNRSRKHHHKHNHKKRKVINKKKVTNTQININKKVVNKRKIIKKRTHKINKIHNIENIVHHIYRQPKVKPQINVRVRIRPISTQSDGPCEDGCGEEVDNDVEALINGIPKSTDVEISSSADKNQSEIGNNDRKLENPAEEIMLPSQMDNIGFLGNSGLSLGNIGTVENMQEERVLKNIKERAAPNKEDMKNMNFYRNMPAKEIRMAFRDFQKSMGAKGKQMKQLF